VIYDDPAPGDLDSSDLDANNVEGTPPAETSVVSEPIGSVELVSAEAEDIADSAMGHSPGALPLPVGAAIATVDTVFFYGRSASSPGLYQDNLAEGSLTTVSDPINLFPTALDGLFTAAPGGLGGSGTASTESSSRTFHLVEGTSGKNFLIGTAADNALFGFGSDDLILTSRGQNLAFGGEGNDTLVGGSGDNGLFGGAAMMRSRAGSVTTCWWVALATTFSTVAAGPTR
jgi:hypothetical protein